MGWLQKWPQSFPSLYLPPLQLTLQIFSSRGAPLKYDLVLWFALIYRMGWNWWDSRSKPRSREVLCSFVLSFGTLPPLWGQVWINSLEGCEKHVEESWVISAKAPEFSKSPADLFADTDTWVSPNEINQAQPRSPELSNPSRLVRNNKRFLYYANKFYVIKANWYMRQLWLYPPFIHPRIQFLVKSSLSDPDYSLAMFHKCSRKV